jgi:hypothetical protein
MPYEKFARTCIWLSLQADDSELRDMLMHLARIWIRAGLKKQTILMGPPDTVEKLIPGNRVSSRNGSNTARAGADVPR